MDHGEGASTVHNGTGTPFQKNERVLKCICLLRMLKIDQLMPSKPSSKPKGSCTQLYWCVTRLVSKTANSMAAEVASPNREGLSLAIELGRLVRV